MKRIQILMLPLLVSAPVLMAQDLDRVQPQPAPQMVDVPSSTTPTETSDFELAALEGEQVLLESLEGIHFLTDESQLNQLDPDDIDELGADLSRLPHLRTLDTAVILDHFVSRPVSAESMQRMLVVVRQYLRQLGRPFSVVYYPEQDITDGYLAMVVLESQFTGDIEVVGNQYFDDEQYRRAIQLQPGDVIDQRQLDGDLAWINRNPFRAATVEASAGDQPGTTKLVVRARDRLPVRVYMGANNTGTQSTKEERVLAGLNWGNAFGLGHQMNVQLTGDPEFEHSRSLSGSYLMDTSRRHLLTFSGAFSESDAIVDDPFTLEGQSWQLGALYQVPLEGTQDGRLAHNVNVGLDFKSSDNNFDFAEVPISDNLTHVIQMRMQYSGVYRDDAGYTTWGVTLTAAPGDLTSHNDDRFFNESRARASASYVYANVDLGRRVAIPLLQGWEWEGSLRAQLSSDPLIGSEQLAAGGAASLRGYEEGEVYADHGVILSQEVWLPAIRSADRFGGLGDSLRFYLFQDYGQTGSVDPLPGEKTIEQHSLGLGLDYQLAQKLSLQTSYGYQITESGRGDPDDNGRLHFSAQWSF